MKCCDLTPGKLRSKIELQSQIRKDDGSGGYSLEWITYATVQGAVIKQGMSEKDRQGHVAEVRTLQAAIRYRSDVEPQHRAIVDGVTYNLRAVTDMELRRRWLVLRMESGVAP